MYIFAMNCSPLCCVLVVMLTLPCCIEGIIGADCAVSFGFLCDENTEECVANACACRMGYIANNWDPTFCTDIDECATDQHSCDSYNAECTNTDGSFYCTCHVGYEGEGVRCRDNDECVTGLHNCHVKGECTNTDGSYYCTCHAGYESDGGSCKDLDECATDQHDCHYNAECTNKDGSFDCNCHAGYRGNGLTCTDLDECATHQDNCRYKAECTNTDGSFYCTCHAGYRGNGVTCTDLDECVTDQHNCDNNNAECTNTDGSFDCTCHDGYEGDGFTCTDIDECSTDAHNYCDFNAECTNIAGSFYCNCTAGYVDYGSTCTDEDECSSGTHNCDYNAECTNIYGSFFCRCNLGFTGDGRTCIDHDKCSIGLHNCDSNAVCINTPTSFYDCTCNTGYTGNGFTCTDENECAIETHNCDHNAICTNTFGTFECSCRNGYIGDGVTCLVETPEMLVITCHHCEPDIILGDELKVVKGQSLDISCADTSTTPGKSPIMSWPEKLSSPSDTLQLDRVSRSHTGNLTCTVTYDEQGNPVDYLTKTVLLNVLYAPKVHSLTDRRVVIGTNISIPCITTPGNPNTTIYRWTRSVDGWSQTTNIMTLYDIGIADTGKYTCTAENIMDPTGKSLISGVDFQEFTLTAIKAGIAAATEEDKPQTGIIIGASVGSVVVIVVLVVVVVFIVRRFRSTNRTDNDIGKQTYTSGSERVQHVAAISNPEPVYNYIYDNPGTESTDKEKSEYESLDVMNRPNNQYVELQPKAVDKADHTYFVLEA